MSILKTILRQQATQHDIYHLDASYTSQTTAIKTHKHITVISESIATTCYFFLHTTKADVVQVDMNVCLRECGYGILIVNIAQLWIITATREAIMDYSALMAFGGAEVVVVGGISMSCLYLTVICAIWRARVGIDSSFQMRAHINGKH